MIDEVFGTGTQFDLIGSDASLVDDPLPPDRREVVTQKISQRRIAGRFDRQLFSRGTADSTDELFRVLEVEDDLFDDRNDLKSRLF